MQIRNPSQPNAAPGAYARSRRTVDLAGYPDLVVVYLGYRVNKWRALRSLWRIGLGVRAIKTAPPDGLLAHESVLFGFMHLGFRQYWRDFESLEAFTRAPRHQAWWGDFARDPSVGGIWHETYRLRGGFEAIYSGVRPLGLAGFAPERMPHGGFASARQRLQPEASPAPLAG